MITKDDIQKLKSYTNLVDVVRFMYYDLDDKRTCDGNCDENPPYTKCSECEISSLINRIGEDIRETVTVIE